MSLQPNHKPHPHNGRAAHGAVLPGYTLATDMNSLCGKLFPLLLTLIPAPTADGWKRYNFNQNTLSIELPFPLAKQDPNALTPEWMAKEPGLAIRLSALPSP